MHSSEPLKRIGMKPFGCHPAIRTSGAARFFFQGSCLAKQILPWYRSLISRAGLTKKKIRAKCWKPSAFVQCVFEASKKADVSCIVHARSRAQFFAIFHTFRLLGCVVCHVCSTSPTSGARALADAKLGQRSKSWCRIISRRLAGPEMQCHDLLKSLSYLWSCAPCIRSPILNEFIRPKCCAQGKGNQIARPASQNAFEKISKYFIRILMGEFSYAFFRAVDKLTCVRMRPPGCHPAIRTSGAARILL